MEKPFEWSRGICGHTKYSLHPSRHPLFVPRNQKFYYVFFLCYFMDSLWAYFWKGKLFYINKWRCLFPTHNFLPPPPSRKESSLLSSHLRRCKGQKGSVALKPFGLAHMMTSWYTEEEAGAQEDSGLLFSKNPPERPALGPRGASYLILS